VGVDFVIAAPMATANAFVMSHIAIYRNATRTIVNYR
jgi:hypothetical protein